MLSKLQSHFAPSREQEALRKFSEHLLFFGKTSFFSLFSILVLFGAGTYCIGRVDVLRMVFFHLAFLFSCIYGIYSVLLGALYVPQLGAWGAVIATRRTKKQLKKVLYRVDWKTRETVRKSGAVSVFRPRARQGDMSLPKE